MNNDKLNLIKLKVKNKSLAEEARIIKGEIRKLKKHNIHNRNGFAISSLREHRTIVVRNEARATNLAIAYLKGREYNSVENKRKDEYGFMYYIVPRVITIVKKYSGVKFNEKALRSWLKA